MAGNDNELGQVTLHEYFTAPFKVVHKTQFKRCHTLNRCNADEFMRQSRNNFIKTVINGESRAARHRCIRHL